MPPHPPTVCHLRTHARVAKVGPCRLYVSPGWAVSDPSSLRHPATAQCWNLSERECVL